MNMVNEKTSSERVTRKRQARIDGILDVALNIMSRNGLEAMSMHQVAAELDLTVGALYRYFPSKGVMVANLERRVIRDYGADLVRMVIDEAPDVSGAGDSVALLVPLVRLGLAYRKLCHEKPVHMQLINALLANPGHMLPEAEGQLVIETMFEIFEPFEAMVQQAMDAGAMSQGDAGARLLMSWNASRAVLQLAKLSTFDPKRFDNSILFYETNLTLMRGWGADADAVSAAWTIANEGLE